MVITPASMELAELDVAIIFPMVPKFVELSRTGVSLVARAAVVARSKIHRAQATPAATRLESLNSLVACLEAKELAAVIQASVELGALGAAATCAVPKLVELARPAFLGTASPRPPSRR